MLGRFLSKTKENQKMNVKSRILSLPQSVPLNELIFMTKRGFVARKVASYLGMKVIAGEIFFQSFSLGSIKEDEGETKGFAGNMSIEEEEPHVAQDILYLSDYLLKSINTQDDVYGQIDALSVSNQIKNALLKVYGLYKEDLAASTAHPKEETFGNQEKWKVYRDVIFAATQEKFLLVNQHELHAFQNGQVLFQSMIEQIPDIANVRNTVRGILESMGYTKSDLMSLLLVLSEAVTNTLKHAEGGKTQLVYDSNNDELKIVVEDSGAGFPLEQLPKATLMAGYSTKKSLGQGFNLMLKMSKQLCLHTTNQGSTIVLVFDGFNKGGVLNETG
ncbi:hypothetical protein GCM10011391_05420 [Pullulanibacillus camelliae]|uniref:Histidine kinase/HSP90-like ATPase domain-containing protein n=1 Tax=Pullulanibacillus camelliae TaxID=1707096 RepID=A0A8J2VGV2_9BACL|nr:ATP-binding protein [Pullulanibacillus camelliae]GGE29817.1 hypothetical protein GCM10011391_05420 [Pullulanibacillus camelliae]